MDMINELDRIIKHESITTVFQPIVSLEDGNIIGYEALSRGPENSPLQNPEKLFSAAHEYNRLWDLECLCYRNIILYKVLYKGPENSPLQNPEKLFSAAHEYNRLWDLECLCRSKAIKRAQYIDKNKHLFINVDPFVFKDEKYKKGFTKEFLAKHNMSPETIIFDIKTNCVHNLFTSPGEFSEGACDRGAKNHI